jgi:hypothetical protein
MIIRYSKFIYSQLFWNSFKIMINFYSLFIIFHALYYLTMINVLFIHFSYSFDLMDYLINMVIFSFMIPFNFYNNKK